MITLERSPIWNRLLVEHFDSTAGKTFEWGVFDCALNVADSTLAMTGFDLAKDFRGTYSDEEGAYRALQEHGYENMLDCAEKNLPRADSPLLGHDGDIAAFKPENHWMLGLLYRGRAFAPSPGFRGMSSVSIRNVDVVFKVGNP